jgi:hypothetical protein
MRINLCSSSILIFYLNFTLLESLNTIAPPSAVSSGELNQRNGSGNHVLNSLDYKHYIDDFNDKDDEVRISVRIRSSWE